MGLVYGDFQRLIRFDISAWLPIKAIQMSSMAIKSENGLWRQEYFDREAFIEKLHSI
jgi:hypothetical protein